MSYNAFVAEDRRLVILHILQGVAERRANQYVLRSALKSLGYDELIETIQNDLSWLAKQGLIKSHELDAGLVLAVLTDYGDQAARGIVRVAGVAVPAVG
jgi:Fe2+ or Zn2+ uptake regulation protein